MAELRRVDPRALLPNPDNPRRTPVPAAFDEGLRASIAAVGIIHAPLVAEHPNGRLVIIAGHRRTAQAIAAGLAEIDVDVRSPEEAADAMRAFAENAVRAPAGAVDTWRGIERLEAAGWSEQAIADALAQPLRTVRRLKLLARLHPPMLDAIAAGAMPHEEQLRTIAAATAEEQAEVWKRHRPKKGQPPTWSEVARALAKRRIPFAAARFGEDLAAAYGVRWQEDLFAPAGEDGRYTTDAEAFFGAQQEWLANNLPPKAKLLPVDPYGQVELPKGAQRVWDKPRRGDVEGRCVHPQTGEIVVIHYTPAPDKPGGKAKAKGGGAPADDAVPATPARSRPQLSQRGVAMIGELRTEALGAALRAAPLDDLALLALLVLALTARNVSVDSPAPGGWHGGRAALAGPLTEGGALATDPETIRRAAREALAAVLSLRDDRTASGPVALLAGVAAGATEHLPTMATEEFLACLSKAALEQAASAARVAPRNTARDTRAAMVRELAGTRWLHPRAAFDAAEAAEATATDPAAEDDGDGFELDGFDADGGEGADALPAEAAAAA